MSKRNANRASLCAKTSSDENGDMEPPSKRRAKEMSMACLLGSGKNDCSGRIESSDGSLNLTVIRKTSTKIDVEINGNLTAVNCEGEGEDDYIRVTLNDVLKNCQVSELSAGQLYRVTATDNNQHRTSIDFRAVFTLDEQREMLRKAENFFYGTMQTCDQVYRAKPESYFEEIASNDHNIMKVRRKGTNGDSATIINGVALDGLFFSASVPPKLMSHFGERRVLIPASEMIKHDSRLYFADFYCMYRAHYVTVVLTRPGTPADEFCRDRLLPLDLADNTFITRDPQSGSVRVCNSVGALGLKGGVWIELFCTHDIDLSASYCEFKTVPCNGISSPNRLHKTLGCCHCNLDSVLAVTVPTVT